MTLNQEQIAAVQARGDLALVSLSAIRNASQAAQVRLLQTVNRLQKMKLPMTTEDGKPTVANVLMSEMEIINQSLTEVFAISNTVVQELNALAEQHGVARTNDETVREVIGYIRQTSPAYEKMSEQDIRKEFGL